jgi:hypothetical protein
MMASCRRHDKTSRVGCLEEQSEAANNHDLKERSLGAALCFENLEPVRLVGTDSPSAINGKASYRDGYSG